MDATCSCAPIARFSRSGQVEKIGSPSANARAPDKCPGVAPYPTPRFRRNRISMRPSRRVGFMLVSKKVQDACRISTSVLGKLPDKRLCIFAAPPSADKCDCPQGIRPALSVPAASMSRLLRNHGPQETTAHPVGPLFLRYLPQPPRQYLMQSGAPPTHSGPSSISPSTFFQERNSSAAKL